MFGKDAQKLELSFIVGKKVIWFILKDSLAVLQMIKQLVLHDPAISLLGIHPRKMKPYVHTKTCSQIFMALLFKIAKR